MARLRSIPSRLSPAPTRLPPPRKEVDPHYLSAEHKAWSAEVFKRAAGRCQAPGCTKAAPEHRMFADHIVEMKDGGSATDPANGQLLCGAHHSAKTAKVRMERAARPLPRANLP